MGVKKFYPFWYELKRNGELHKNPNKTLHIVFKTSIKLKFDAARSIKYGSMMWILIILILLYSKFDL